MRLLKHGRLALIALVASTTAHGEDRWMTEARCTGQLTVAGIFFISVKNPSRLHQNTSESCAQLDRSTVDNKTFVERSEPLPRFGISPYHRGLMMSLNFRF